MQTAKHHKAIELGLFIPEKLLRQAQLEGQEFEVELRPHEIRITPNKHKLEAKPLTKDSPIWKSVGIGSADFNGRDHDEALYG